MKTFVWIKTSFEGFHRWKDAPEEVAFLQQWHRHRFHVKLSVSVNHDNRDVEFILLQRRVRKYIDEFYELQYFESSCEMIAKDLLYQFNASSVEVSEDGENGALVEV